MNIMNHFLLESEITLCTTNVCMLQNYRWLMMHISSHLWWSKAGVACWSGQLWVV